MDGYFRVIRYALLNFPLIALVFTLPFLFWHYKKYGAVPLLRTAVVYSLVLYCITVYFLVIFPLPKQEAVAAMTTARYQLQPLHGLRVFLRWRTPDFTQLSGWWALLNAGFMREMFFNTCMLLPLGVYLRYYFKRKFWHTALLGFAVSLFLELTQLSGLYGIYPRPYRLFDVTDLMTNTLGAMLGYALTPLFCFFLPSRDMLDAQAYRKGETVPVLRRLFAFGIDWVLIGAAVALCDVVVLRFWPHFGLLRASLALGYVGAFVYFVLLQWLCGGRTIGKSALRLRITHTNTTKPRFWQLFLQYFLLYFLILPSPVYLLYFLRKMFVSSSEVPTYTGLFGALAFGLVFVFFCIEVLMKLLGSQNEFFFAKLCKLNILSTIVPPQTDVEEKAPVATVQDSEADET